MSSRTAHQQRNHKQRQKLNAKCSYKGSKDNIPTFVHLNMARQRAAFAAVLATILGPLTRRRKYA